MVHFFIFYDIQIRVKFVNLYEIGVDWYNEKRHRHLYLIFLLLNAYILQEICISALLIPSNEIISNFTLAYHTRKLDISFDVCT